MTLTYDVLFCFFNVQNLFRKFYNFLWENFQENVFIALIFKIIEHVNFKAAGGFCP